MYIPKPFFITDSAQIDELVLNIRSVDLVSVGSSGEILATLVPFIWQKSENSLGSLIMHFSKGNEQWKSIKCGDSGLAIAHGDQSYISPANYENKVTDRKVVPTWNYQSIHFSGALRISEDVEELREIVTQLTQFHEKSRPQPWSVNDSDPTYLEAQLHGIVAVYLDINKVEAKAKMSQNRSVIDRSAIINDLENSQRLEDQSVAKYMKELDQS